MRRPTPKTQIPRIYSNSMSVKMQKRGAGTRLHEHYCWCLLLIGFILMLCELCAVGFEFGWRKQRNCNIFLRSDMGEILWKFILFFPKKERMSTTKHTLGEFYAYACEHSVKEKMEWNGKLCSVMSFYEFSRVFSVMLVRVGVYHHYRQASGITRMWSRKKE